MKCVLRIPSKEPYAYIEFEEEPPQNQTNVEKKQWQRDLIKTHIKMIAYYKQEQAKYDKEAPPFE